MDVLVTTHVTRDPGVTSTELFQACPKRKVTKELGSGTRPEKLAFMAWACTWVGWGVGERTVGVVVSSSSRAHARHGTALCGVVGRAVLGVHR